jgi:TorA maturation chaperone TorD
MPPLPDTATPPDETEQARAGLYRLLGAALSHPPTERLLDSLRNLRVAETGTQIGAALARLARAAQATNLDRTRREYDALFIGIARGELVPYASFYLTGFLHDRPLARLRADLAALGLAAAPGHPDPEDHAGTLCELMAGLIDGGHGAPRPLDGQRRFFERHLAPWLDRFFADLEEAPGVALYQHVGELGRAFLAVEGAAFGMEVP